jgi:hypothetical protein
MMLWLAQRMGGGVGAEEPLLASTGELESPFENGLAAYQS